MEPPRVDVRERRGAHAAHAMSREFLVLTGGAAGGG
jgi:hypothetical protein